MSSRAAPLRLCMIQIRRQSLSGRQKGEAGIRSRPSTVTLPRCHAICTRMSYDTSQGPKPQQCSREGGSPVFFPPQAVALLDHWIPACAGILARPAIPRRLALRSRPRVRTKHSSEPRRRRSSTRAPHFAGNTAPPRQQRATPHPATPPARRIRPAAAAAPCPAATGGRRSRASATARRGARRAAAACPTGSSCAAGRRADRRASPR